jgi:hypothetical protein
VTGIQVSFVKPDEPSNWGNLKGWVSR